MVSLPQGMLAFLSFFFFLSSASDDSEELKVDIGGRVHDLFSGLHFDDLLKDVPTAMRPPSIVLFYSQENKECYSKYMEMDFAETVETQLPARERLMAAKYNMDLHKRRHWYSFTPEMDLPNRFGVEECPSLVSVPRECDGWTKWCFPEDECTTFEEQCTGWSFWDGNGNWVEWVKELIKQEGEPHIATILGNYKKQGDWIQTRAAVTTTSHVRNSFLSPNMPTWSESGFKVMDIPDELYTRLMNHFNKYKPHIYPEAWNTYQASQINFHEVPTKMVSLDFDPVERDSLARDIFQPLLEEWCQCNLTFNAFFGIRQYQEGAWLRPHVDRIDTHTISATLSLKQWDMTDPWPLQGVAHNGSFINYEHPPKTMFLYESTTVIHGRPWLSTGKHLGCFIHFSPIPRKEYAEQCRVARSKCNKYKNRIAYRSMPTEEPKNPQMYEMGGFLETSDLKSHRIDEPSNQVDQRIPVEFKNTHQRALSLFWKQNNYNSILQQVLAPDETTVVHTYPGHQFIWSDKLSIPKNSAAPLAKDCEIVRITQGQKLYESDTKRFYPHLDL